MASSSEQGPHVLAQRLIATARERPLAGPVLEIGTGSGRNTRALVAAGLTVDEVDDSVPYTQLPAAYERYGAALSTHAYLHGSSDKVRAGLAELRRVVLRDAPIFLTLGSIRDARYGLGMRFDDSSFAPGDGDEAGIPHAYFDRDGVVDLLRGYTIVSLDEVDADDTVGRWAHDDTEVGRVHWFVVATKDVIAAQ
jgi:hypothetical protein